MALNYSRLGFSGNAEYKGWNNIVLSPTTVGKRKQLKSGMDDFTSFTWRGVNAFDVFGAFIINNKGTLKFYNGPSFSNEYTKPQFESAAGQLVGVSFNVQKIDFTIGVYWITENDYRKLIDWLNPYEISTLTFGFEQEYYYMAKIASIGDATRHIVGIETINGKKEYCYYTEIKLTFELQGDPCAYRKIQYEFRGSETYPSGEVQSTNLDVYEYSYALPISNNLIADNNFQSQLAMPFKYKMHLQLNPILLSDTTSRYFFNDLLIDGYSHEEVDLSFDFGRRSFIGFIWDGFTLQFKRLNSTFEIVYQNGQWKGPEREININESDFNFVNCEFLINNLTVLMNNENVSLLKLLESTMKNNVISLDAITYYNNFEETRLFNAVLKNLSYGDFTIENGKYYLDIIYDSATGLLYWDRGDSKLFLLSRLSTSSTGSRIVDTLNSTSYKVLGTFDNWDFDLYKWQLKLKLTSSLPIEDPHLEEERNYYIEMRARTNLI